MQLNDFRTSNRFEPFDIPAIHRAYAQSIAWDGSSPLSFNAMPEPFASFKAEAERLNAEAARQFDVERRQRRPIGMTEWEARGSDE